MGIVKTSGALPAVTATSLKSKINGNLSMKAAFTVTHNSRVSQDIKKTDAITSVALVYDL